MSSFTNTRKYRCVYCGGFAEARDHIIPRSFICREGNSGFDDVNNIVAACGRCNSFKSNKIFDTIEEIKNYLFERYCNKYIKVLSMPDWSEKELSELEGALKKSISSYMRQKKALELRLSILEMPGLYYEE
mgnify:CR=1 FL=1